MISKRISCRHWSRPRPGLVKIRGLHFSEMPILVTQAAKTNSLRRISSHVNGGYWLATLLCMFIIIIILPPKFHSSKSSYWQL